MFLQLRSRLDDGTPDDMLSWLLAKRPGGVYETNVGSGEGTRTVRGEWKNLDSDPSYLVIVENDERAVAQSLKAANRPFYVSPKGYAVLPYNLRGITTALKSAIGGKNPSPDTITGEDLAKPRNLSVVIGPFLASKERIERTFSEFGMKVDVQASGDLVSVISLSAKTSLREFLQKVVVGCYHLSVKEADKKFLEDAQIEALIKASQDWLWKCPNADFVVQSITGGHAGHKKTFHESMKDSIESSEPSEVPEVKEIEGYVISEKKISIHTLRHDKILSAIPSDECKRIVDLGCGDGKLTLRLVDNFKESDITAIEADSTSLQRLRRRARGVRAVLSNILHPPVDESSLGPDVLILSEVIEHLEAADRAKLMQQVCHMWRPKRVLLTTPNRDHNKLFGMEEGERRHPDHRIEYDANDLKREVLTPLERAGYSVQVVDVIDGEESQPSFFVVAVDQTRANPSTKMLRAARSAEAPIFLPRCGYEVRSDAMEEGLRDRGFLGNKDNIFYLAPTVPPVDYSPRAPDFLEHPTAAFDYYGERGVRYLIEQNKAMGSRCHVLYFKDEETALAAGFGQKLILITRNGSLMTKDRAILDEMHDEMKREIESGGRLSSFDAVIFDAEYMPWSAKAGRDHYGLIGREFRKPAEAAKLDKSFSGKSTENVDKFLDVLSWFDQPEEKPWIEIFDCMAGMRVDRKGRGFRDIQLFHGRLGQMDRYWLYSNFHDGKMVRRCETSMVDLTSAWECQSSVDRWLKYTTEGKGEGFVYKPVDFTMLEDGSSVQPMLKVRGKDYLRIIYGWDYLEPEIFTKLTDRKIKPKRRLATVENEIADQILSAFLKSRHEMRERLIAAFFGVERVDGSEIDATL